MIWPHIMPSVGDGQIWALYSPSYKSGEKVSLTTRKRFRKPEFFVPEWKIVFSVQGQQAAFFARGRKIIHEGSLKTTRGKFQPEVWNEVSNRGLKFPPSGLQTVPSGWFSDQVRKKPPCPRSEWCFLHLGRQKTSVSIFKIGVPLFVIDFWNRTTQVYR